MSLRTDVILFKGSTLRVSARTFLYLLLFGLLVSYGLMGGNWASFFVLSLAAVLPMAAVITLVTAWGNRFFFDDERGAIVKPGRRPVPYGRITGIFINEQGHSLDVFLKQKWRGTTFLIEALDISERGRLEEGLTARLPGLQVRKKRWTTAVAVGVMLVLLLAGFGAAHGYLYKRYPQLAVSPQAVTWAEMKKGKKLSQLQYLEGFEFTLPAGAKLVSDMDSQLFFEDKIKKFRVKVLANIQRPEPVSFNALLRRGMGVRDYYELLDLSYRSRIGIIPVFLRSLELQGLDNITAYRIGPPFLRGYVTQGKRDGVEETHIVLVGDRPNEEIHFFITGPKRAPEDILKTIVSSTRLVRLPGT